MAILEILIFAVTLIQRYHVTGDGNLEIIPTMHGAGRTAHPQVETQLQTKIKLKDCFKLLVEFPALASPTVHQVVVL